MSSEKRNILDESIFNYSYRQLLMAFGKKETQETKEQMRNWWEKIKNRWRGIPFAKACSNVVDEEKTFPSFAVLRAHYHREDLNYPEDGMSAEERERFWDSLKECGFCADGYVYLKDKKESSFVGTCQCEKGHKRAERNRRMISINPQTLKIGETQFDGSSLYHLDPMAHAKWSDLTTAECATMLSMLPREGLLQKDFLKYLMKNRRDIYSDLLKKEEKFISNATGLGPIVDAIVKNKIDWDKHDREREAHLKEVYGKDWRSKDVV